MQLKADGAAVGEPVILDESNGWTYTWTDLAKRADGKDIVYEVEEAKVEGYEPEYSEAGDTITITNTEVTSKTVTKVWDDADNQDRVRPASVKVQLKADGESIGETVELSESNGWTYTWTNLPAKANGKTIVYTVEEESVKGYTASYSEDTFTITNTHIPQNGSISVSKRVTFNGRGIKLDKSFYVALFTDAEGTNRYSDVMELRISGDEQSDGTATVTFTNLPYGTYYVIETEADGSKFLGDDMGIQIVASVTNETITLSPANLTGAASITNDYKDTPPDGFTYTEEPETEFESESETESEEESETESETKKTTAKAAKTGDETNYMMYILLCILAAVLCGAGVYFKKRKRVD